MNEVAEEIYKDSGIEWLDSIPESWDIMRLKDIAIIETGGKNTEDKEQDGKYPFFVRSQTVEYINSYSFDGEAILTAGDGVGVGKVFHHYIGKFETHQRVYRISGFHKINGRFLFHFIQANLSKEVMKFNVKATVDSLRMPMFQRFPVVLPPLPQQSAIAKYIDIQTAAFDRKIDLLEQKINLYQTLRKTIINETVCRGLNPNAPRKDSGIEWIGEIPAHWEVKRLKDVGRVVLGKMLNNTGKAGYVLKPYLKSKNITWLSPSIKSVDEMYFSPDELISYRIKKNDLLISEGGEVGKTCIWNDELPECYIQNSVHKITIHPRNNPHYYLYLSFAMGAVGFYDSIVNQVSIKHLTWEKFIRILVLVPPYEEQRAIADHIAQGTRKIDAVTGNLTAQITTLKELRKTLINDVVTGKINVTA